jgi:hypothetical protein
MRKNTPERWRSIMANPDQAIARWFDVVRGRKDRFLSCRNIDSTSDTVFSYGRHFPLARVIRDADGDRAFWLLNGDTFSNTTARHQSAVRSHVRGDRHAIIPQSVLDAAQVDIATIKLLDVTSDRTLTTQHRARTMPPRAQWQEHQHHDDEQRTAYEDKVWQAQADSLQGSIDFWRAHGRDDLHFDEERLAKHLSTTAKLYAERTNDHRYKYQQYERVYSHTTRHLYLSHREVTVTEDEQGTLYEWETTRHILGESLIEARIPHYVRSTTCKACSGTGWTHVSPLVNRHYYTDSYGGRCGTCHGGKVRKQVYRTARFLSGFDHNERRPSYFFCELPPCDAETVEQAYDALKPAAVLTAESLGRAVVRQGDIFGIDAPSVTTRALRAGGATFARSGNLFGTNHEATETATMPTGAVYARGCVRHVPDFRAPDHARLSLPGRGWYLMQKNTVPLTA